MGFIRADDEAEARKVLIKRGMKLRALVMEETRKNILSDEQKKESVGQPTDKSSQSDDNDAPWKDLPLGGSLDDSVSSDQRGHHDRTALPSLSSDSSEISHKSSHSSAAGAHIDVSSAGDLNTAGTLHARITQASPQRTVQSATQKGKEASKAKKGFLLSLHRLMPIPSTELLIFFNQMSLLYKTGVPLARGLALMEQQTTNLHMREVIEDIRTRVESGISFTGSMHVHQKVFPRIYLALIHSGEVSGHLENMLFRSAGLKENEMKLSMRIQQAVTYPIIVFVAMAIFVVLLGKVLVLNVLPILLAGKVHIPFFTQTLIFFYKVMTSPLFFLTAALLIIIFYKSIKRIIRSESFRLSTDRLLIALPLLGSLVHKVALSRFCYTLSVVLESGINLDSAIMLAAESSANRQCEYECQELKRSIEGGQSVFDGMNALNFFPRAVKDMVKVGEMSGTLPQMLSRVAVFMELEVEYALVVFYQAIEPILVVFLGLAIALIALGVLAPLNSIFSTIGS
ncbi:MAG: type II secretion system F family protein [Vulcanimicrobiota bacterium]